MLQAGEINHLAKNNPFVGLHTSADEVDLAPLIKQKNELVDDLRNSKYVDLIDDYGFKLIKGEAKFVDEKTVEVNGMQLSAKRFLKEELAGIEKNLNELRKRIKEKEAEYVNQAAVLGVTLSKAAMDPLIYGRDFDLIVVDEASMAYIPQVAFAASLGKRIVVCGDFKQLPPIAMSESRLVEMWLRRDIFHGAKIVGVVERGQEHPNLFMLKEQRRMHPDISSFTNHFIYHNKVSGHETVRKKRQAIANKNPFPNEAATLVDLSRMGAYCLKESATDSRFNLLSALISMQLILAG